jgi:hypothetical protein
MPARAGTLAPAMLSAPLKRRPRQFPNSEARPFREGHGRVRRRIPIRTPIRSRWPRGRSRGFRRSVWEALRRGCCEAPQHAHADRAQPRPRAGNPGRRGGSAGQRWGGAPGVRRCRGTGRDPSPPRCGADYAVRFVQRSPDVRWVGGGRPAGVVDRRGLRLLPVHFGGSARAGLVGSSGDANVRAQRAGCDSDIDRLKIPERLTLPAPRLVARRWQARHRDVGVEILRREVMGVARNGPCRSSLGAAASRGRHAL